MRKILRVAMDGETAKKKAKQFLMKNSLWRSILMKKYFDSGSTWNSHSQEMAINVNIAAYLECCS